MAEQPAQQQEPVDERALIQKVDAELAAAGIEAYTDVHNSRYRLLVAVRNFLAVSVDYLPGWLAQPAQAMRDATELATGKQSLQVEQPAQQQEPVADECDSPEICRVARQCCGQYGTKNLCASTPPPRKPLTDEEIETLWQNTSPYYDHQDFARAIEAAHGIKEKNT